MDYSYIIIPLIVGITSQVLKLLTDSVRGNFDLKNLLISYGGMPSAHTALATSITTLVGLELGVDSLLFAVSFVFTVLIARDAISFRNTLGKQATIINRFMAQLPAAQTAGLPRLREQMGHSLLEVAAGALWGGVITFFLFLI